MLETVVHVLNILTQLVWIGFGITVAVMLWRA